MYYATEYRVAASRLGGGVTRRFGVSGQRTVKGGVSFSFIFGICFVGAQRPVVIGLRIRAR